MKDYRWRPIEDLPENWPELVAPELPALSAAWQKYSEKLRDSDSLKHFNERLIREWAIETGIIENLYSIDRGVTQTLIEKGIEASLIPHGSTDKPVERILPMLKDQQEVVEGLFDFVAQRRELSTSYIKQSIRLSRGIKRRPLQLTHWGELLMPLYCVANGNDFLTIQRGLMAVFMNTARPNMWPPK